MLLIERIVGKWFRNKNLLGVKEFYNSNSDLVDYIYNEQKDLNELPSNNDNKSNVIKLN